MKTPRQRLAAVVGKCFDGQKQSARDEMRHAALSQKLGRDITSSEDLTAEEVTMLLQRWEHYLAPFSPSDAARREIAELVKRYQDTHVQTEMVLSNG